MVLTKKTVSLFAWLTISSFLLFTLGILATTKNSTKRAKVEVPVRSGLQAACQPSDGCPALSVYARDLNQLALNNGTDQISGYDKEILQAARILSMQSEKNPVIVGEPGTDAKQLALAIAESIVSGSAPEALSNKQIFSLDLNALFAKAKDAAEIKSRLSAVLNDVEKSKGKIILFIDELHQFVGDQSAKDVSDALQTALASKKVHVIGATSAGAFHQYIADNSSLELLFQPVMLSIESATANSNSRKVSTNTIWWTCQRTYA